MSATSISSAAAAVDNCTKSASSIRVLPPSARREAINNDSSSSSRRGRRRNSIIDRPNDSSEGSSDGRMQFDDDNDRNDDSGPTFYSGDFDFAETGTSFLSPSARIPHGSLTASSSQRGTSSTATRNERKYAKKEGIAFEDLPTTTASSASTAGVTTTITDRHVDDTQSLDELKSDLAALRKSLDQLSESNKDLERKLAEAHKDNSTSRRPHDASSQHHHSSSRRGSGGNTHYCGAEEQRCYRRGEELNFENKDYSYKRNYEAMHHEENNHSTYQQSSHRPEQHYISDDHSADDATIRRGQDRREQRSSFSHRPEQHYISDDRSADDASIRRGQDRRERRSSFLNASRRRWSCLYLLSTTTLLLIIIA